MATKLTKKQQTQLTEKLTGIIQRDNALQLRLSMDNSVNEMNVNQISGELNRIHDMAIGKELPTVISIPVNQLGSGDPSPDNIRPISGYVIDGIGTVYSGDLNIETGVLTVTYGGVDLGSLNWIYAPGSALNFRCSADQGAKPPNSSADTPNAFCSAMPVVDYTSLSIGAYDGITIIFASSGQAGKFWARSGLYTDAASFKTAMSGVMFVYELVTPETYTLTPQQMIQLLDQL